MVPAAFETNNENRVDLWSKNNYYKLNMMKPFLIQNGEKVQLKENLDKISVPLEMISHIVQVKEITLIYTHDSKAHICSLTIDIFESELKGFGFEKANHTTLVNTKQINGIYFNNSRIITLKNNVKIKISRRRMYKFKTQLLKYSL
jgi:DNA-binding LytR/AlgR family response regulator